MGKISKLQIFFFVCVCVGGGGGGGGEEGRFGTITKTSSSRAISHHLVGSLYVHRLIDVPHPHLQISLVTYREPYLYHSSGK